MHEIDRETLDHLGLSPERPSLKLASHRSSSRVHLVAGSPRGVAFPQVSEERRRCERFEPGQARVSETARLRPGVEARVLDIGARGALIELPARLHVGLRVEVSLVTTDSGARLDLAGVVRRCYVASLSPMTYRGAVEFDRQIELRVLDPFTVPPALTA